MSAGERVIVGVFLCVFVAIIAYAIFDLINR